MSLRYWLQHEEEEIQKSLVHHLLAAGVVLVTIAILIGLYLGAVAAAGLHNLDP